MARSKPEFYESFIVVEGRGSFPLDMLRYANAVPARETDSYMVDADLRTRRVLLRKFSRENKIGDGPIEARFRSSGWKVVGWFHGDLDGTERALARVGEAVST